MKKTDPMTEQELLDQLGRLPRERQPDTDLWPGIEARMNRSPSSRTGWIPTAAAAAIVGALVTVFGLSLNEGQMEPNGSQDPRMASNTSYAQLYASNVELEYSGAIRDMAGQMKNWTVATQDPASLEASLKVLQDATEDLRAALAEDPGSMYLAGLLESTHRKQLAVMKQLVMQRLAVTDTDTSMVRT